MKKELLVIVPTRARPEKSVEFYEAFKENSDLSYTDLLFGLDDDDVEYPRLEGVLYEVNPRLRMNGTLNKLAITYAPHYKYIAFLGDDHRIRTKGWDRTLAESIGNFGLAYANDLFQGENMATAIMMSSNIILELGYMSPPEMVHICLDCFWMELGWKTNRLVYHKDVVLEHLHPFAGKAEMDNGYTECNSNSIYERDGAAFKKYMAERFPYDLQKVSRLNV